jgi:hypothetical protein
MVLLKAGAVEHVPKQGTGLILALVLFIHLLYERAFSNMRV